MQNFGKERTKKREKERKKESKEGRKDVLGIRCLRWNHESVGFHPKIWRNDGLFEQNLRPPNIGIIS